MDEINYESSRNDEGELYYGRLALKHKRLNLLIVFGFFPQDTSSWPAYSDILPAYHVDREVGIYYIERIVWMCGVGAFQIVTYVHTYIHI